MDFEKILVIGTIVAAVMILIVLILRRRIPVLKGIEAEIGSKSKAYIAFSNAYKKVCEKANNKALKDLNLAARDVMLVTNEDSKIILTRIISMTERLPARVNIDELHADCRECMESLQADLYNKKPKKKKQR